MKKFFRSKRIEAGVEIIIFICATYLLVQRITGFSLSDLAKEIFHTQFLNSAIPWVQVLMVIILSICLLLKVKYLVRDKLGSAGFNHRDMGKIMEVIALFQETTIDLISRISDSRCCCKAKISHRGRFSAFVQGIAKNLSEFVAVGFSKGEYRRRNLFVSLYEYVQTDKGDALQHICHEDPKRYDISSTLMLIEGPRHQGYECIRALKENRSLVAVLDGKRLRVPGRKRHKTLMHYIGAPLKVAGQTVGFVNLEFHRETYFRDDDEMEEFAQNFFLPFQMLIEQGFAKWQLAQIVEEKCGCGHNI